MGTTAVPRSTSRTLVAHDGQDGQGVGPEDLRRPRRVEAMFAHLGARTSVSFDGPRDVESDRDTHGPSPSQRPVALRRVNSPPTYLRVTSASLERANWLMMGEVAHDVGVSRTCSRPSATTRRRHV